MDNEFAEVIDRLVAQTHAGKVSWEDLSSLSAGDEFRVNFGDVIVEVRQGERIERTDDDSKQYVGYIRVQILNDRGFVVAKTEQDIGQPFYGKLAELLEAARGSGRRRRAVFERLLTTLSK